jgi:hypothetical protein
MEPEMNVHTLEGLILGLLLIAGFITSQIIQHRRKSSR